MPKVPGLTNLHRRSDRGTFYFVRRIPTALLPAFAPVKFYKVPLNTRDLAEAKRLVRRVGAEVQAKFDEAARLLMQGGEAVPVIELGEAAIRAMVSKWLHDSDAAAVRWRLDRLDASDRENLIENLNADEAAIATGVGAASVEAAARDLLAGHKVDLAAGTVSHALLLQLLQDAMLERVRRDRSRAEGDLTFRAYDPSFAGVDPAGPAPVVAPVVQRWTFDTLLDAYEKDKAPGSRTMREWRRIMARLAEHVGHDDPACVAKSDVISFRLALRDRKHAHTGQPLSWKTVEQHLLGISAVYAWAVRNEFLAANPATGVTVEDKDEGEDKRLAYDDEEARTILTAARGQEGYRRWLPWLQAYSGARISEVCQVMTHDVYQDTGTGVWVLDINDDGDDKSLKTPSSRRKVPLHPALVQEGFLAFWETRPKQSRLFPDVAKDADGNWGSSASKWYTRWVRGDLKILDPKKTNHSWRHRFKTVCRGARIPRDVHQVLTGHAGKSEGDGYGGFPLDYLAEEIAKIPSQCDEGPQWTTAKPALL